MPQLNTAHFATQLFWLALTFIPLLLILWKVALPKVGAVLAARAARIAGDLERAAKLRDEAKDVLERYEATLQAPCYLPGIAWPGQESVLARMHELGERIAAAEGHIASARDAALAKVESVAGEAALAATERLIGVKPAAEAVAQAVRGAVGEKR